MIGSITTREAVYKIYEVKTAKALAKRITDNPTKLTIVQAQIGE